MYTATVTTMSTGGRVAIAITTATTMVAVTTAVRETIIIVPPGVIMVAQETNTGLTIAGRYNRNRTRSSQDQQGASIRHRETTTIALQQAEAGHSLVQALHSIAQALRFTDHNQVHQVLDRLHLLNSDRLRHSNTSTQCLHTLEAVEVAVEATGVGDLISEVIKFKRQRELPFSFILLVALG
jgi:hypothetical protein